MLITHHCGGESGSRDVGRCFRRVPRLGCIRQDCVGVEIPLVLRLVDRIHQDVGGEVVHFDTTVAWR